MKVRCIEHMDEFGPNERTFWLEVENVPKEFIEEAKTIDGKTSICLVLEFASSKLVATGLFVWMNREVNYSILTMTETNIGYNMKRLKKKNMTQLNIA